MDRLLIDAAIRGKGMEKLALAGLLQRSRNIPKMVFKRSAGQYSRSEPIRANLDL